MTGATDTGPALSTARATPILVAGVLAGAVVIATELTSDHQDARIVWAVFGPAVGWSFIGTGLYAWRRRPESRTGALMVLLGFAWFLFTLQASDSPLIYTVASAVGGLWGGIFLHLGVSFPSGRLTSARDRGLVIAGYLIIPFAFLPALLVASPGDLRCDDCPENLLLIERHETAAKVLFGLGALLYVGLFVLVLIRSVRHWRAARPLERLQLTPVYVCALLTFLLVTVAQAGAGDIAWWPAFVSTALMPFAFLGGLLRSHVSRLDAELRARFEELRASRARLVEAGDAERRRLERDLHDGAQSRLVALALLLRGARARAEAGSELAAMLDRAAAELQAGLDDLRELARGIHPAVLTDRGLEPALQSLVARAPVPVSVEAPAEERLPGAGRERRLLRRLRGAGQRGQVRPGDARGGRRAARQRAGHRGGHGRRRRRGGRRPGLGPARPRRSRRRARRHALPRQPGGARHARRRPRSRRATRL